MKKEKLAKYVFVSMVFATISMILTHGGLCLSFCLDTRSLVLLILLSGLPLLISQEMFWGLNRKYKWFNQIDIFKATILEMVLFIIWMLTVFFAYTNTIRVSSTS